MDRFVPRDDGKILRGDKKERGDLASVIASEARQSAMSLRGAQQTAMSLRGAQQTAASWQGAQRRGSPWIASFLAMTGKKRDDGKFLAMTEK
jgi:hypothetical protein